MVIFRGVEEALLWTSISTNKIRTNKDVTRPIINWPIAELTWKETFWKDRLDINAFYFWIFYNTQRFQIGLGNIENASAEDVTYSLTTASRRSEEDDLSHSQNDVSETIFKMDSLDEPPSKTENVVVSRLVF